MTAEMALSAMQAGDDFSSTQIISWISSPNFSVSKLLQSCANTILLSSPFARGGNFETACTRASSCFPRRLRSLLERFSSWKF